MSDLFIGEQIKLRPLEPEDLEFIYDCENDTANWRVSNTLTPFSKYILRQYIESSAEDIYSIKQLRLIVESLSTKKAVGAIDLFDFDPYHLRAGIGIIICNDNSKQKGFATEALQLLVNYCFSHLNLHQLYCNIGEKNLPSIKLFEKQGFQLMGEKKDWLKTAMGWETELSYQLLK